MFKTGIMFIFMVVRFSSLAMLVVDTFSLASCRKCKHRLELFLN